MLIGSGVRSGGCPMRLMGGAQAGAIERAQWAQGGALRNRWAGEATVVAGASIADKQAIPSGYRPPGAWVMAPKDGGVSGRNAVRLEFSGAGTGARGKAAAGAAALALVAFGTGGLIVSASGAAALAFNAAGDIFAALAAAGTAGITFGGAGLTVALGITSGAAGIAFSGSWTPYATGAIAGSTDNATELTAAAVAAAVWSSLAASFAVAGTMGAKLNSAASAGDPWGTTIPGAYAPGTAGYLIGNRLDAAVSDVPAATWTYELARVAALHGH